jgi:hypothetical protein
VVVARCPGGCLGAVGGRGGWLSAWAFLECRSVVVADLVGLLCGRTSSDRRIPGWVPVVRNRWHVRTLALQTRSGEAPTSRGRVPLSGLSRGRLVLVVAHSGGRVALA